VALAGTVIASHYAEPLSCRLIAVAVLSARPDTASQTLATLPAGAEVRILDNSRGWAWGYADGLVGYLPAAALG